MEANEAVRRIVLRHLGLLIVCTIVGLVAAVGIGLAHHPRYEASSRVALGGWDPNDASKAKLLADSARAIATSELVVGRAVAAASQPRSVHDVVRSVVVRSAGNSNVVDVAVSDRSPVVAAELSNGVAAGLIDVRWNMLRGGVQSLLDDLDKRVAEVDSAITRYEAAAKAAPPRTQAAEVALQQYSAAIRQRAELDVDRRQLVQIGAAQPRATVLDAAVAPDSPTGTEGSLRLVLGLIAGLLAGLALAAGVEVLRPSAAGPDGIAAAANAPWLGTLARPGEPDVEGRLAAATEAVRLAAAGTGVRTVTLVPVGDGDAASTMAATLHQMDSTVRSGPLPGSLTAVVDPTAPQAGGIVAVTSETIHRADLSPVHHLVATSGWPLLGVILVPKSRRRDDDAAAVVIDLDEAAGSEPDAAVAPASLASAPYAAASEPAPNGSAAPAMDGPSGSTM